jgi:hypothetical protein
LQQTPAPETDATETRPGRLVVRLAVLSFLAMSFNYLNSCHIPPKTAANNSEKTAAKQRDISDISATNSGWHQRHNCNKHGSVRARSRTWRTLFVLHAANVKTRRAEKRSAFRRRFSGKEAGARR